MKLFADYTKWEVLESYSRDYSNYIVQVRMNKSNGFKHFKVTRITDVHSWFHIGFDKDRINQLTEQAITKLKEK